MDQRGGWWLVSYCFWWGRPSHVVCPPSFKKIICCSIYAYYCGLEARVHRINYDPLCFMCGLKIVVPYTHQSKYFQILNNRIMKDIYVFDVILTSYYYYIFQSTSIHVLYENVDSIFLDLNYNIVGSKMMSVNKNCIDQKYHVMTTT